MKKTSILILLLSLCLLACQFALADGGPVARSDDFAAYVDGDGNLFLPGRVEAINKTPASSVVAIDAYRALFLSPDDFTDTDDLYMIDLESFEETLVSADVLDACLADEDTVYLVTNAKRTELVRVDLSDLSHSVAYTAAEPIDRLYLSAEGLVFQLVDQAGAMLYVKDTDRFEIYNDVLPRSGLLTDRFELFLTDDGELYYKNSFNYNANMIDTDVTAYAQLNGTVYYLTRTGTALRLKAYDPSAQTTRIVLTPGVRMENQLTASDGSLFMLTSDGDVCIVNTGAGTLSLFKRYSDLSAYDLPAEYDASGLRIEAMSGQLNVYAVLQEKASKPDFSFIEFETESEVTEPLLKLIDSCALTKEESAWDLLKPTPQYQPLSRGSRGDAVRAIQQPLKDLGYYDYYVDGIFGPRTQAAVQLLQFDLDRPVTGVADAELQKIILSGKLSAYDPYLALARGNRGLRVRLMQERLRELGYLADVADGIFGPRTQKAVQLFQSENRLNVDERATRETLQRLFSDTANRCSSYIDLYPGDSGCRVRELNNRLKELYYLENSPGSSYTSKTTSAVRVFQRTVGMRETGEATVPVLKALFASDAPEAPGYIVLRRGDDNDRVARLQRRLKDLGYFDGKVNGYFGKKTKAAVTLFQKKVGLKPTGVATVRTQQLLFAKDAPEYVKPTVIGVPDIFVEDFEYEQNGIYFISDESASGGYVIFSWDTEGSVESYSVRVTDASGNVYVDTDTLLTSTGVSIATLDYDVVYTLRVTAYPEDGDDDHITRAEVSFARIDTSEEEEDPEIGVVGNPLISIDTVARVENGISYVKPGTVTFHWFAEGDVQEYFVEIRDEGDNEVISATMSDLHASVRSDAMNEGEIYTIFVYAIPVNGTIDNARVKFMRFSLPEVELPEPDPTPVPTPTPTAEPTPEPEKTEEPEANPEPEVTPEPVATFEATPEPEAQVTPEPALVTPEPAPAGDAEPEGTDDTIDEGSEDEAESESGDEQEPAGTIVPEAQGDEEEEPVDAGKTGAQPEEPEEVMSAVSAPDISFDSVESVEGGVNYISGDTVTMRWHAEGDVSAYYVEVRDSGNIVLDSATTAETSLSALATALNPAEVYTLYVAAIPDGGTVENGVFRSAQFAVYSAPFEEPEEEYIEPEQEGAEPEEDYSEPEEQYVEPEEEYVEPEEEYAEPEEEYAEPEEEYVEPEQEYIEPEEEYVEPEQEYVEPEEEYVEPEEEYVESEEEYVEPEEEYVEPEEEYVEPEEEYVEPEEEYVEPEEEYVEPEEEYVEPEEEYVEPEEEYVEPEPDLGGLSSDEVKSIQKKLVKLGWLTKGDYSSGDLDWATAQAISDFQTYCNEELGMALPMIDVDAPFIDDETMGLLESAGGDYANPDA